MAMRAVCPRVPGVRGNCQFVMCARGGAARPQGREARAHITNWHLCACVWCVTQHVCCVVQRGSYIPFEISSSVLKHRPEFSVLTHIHMINVLRL